MLMNPELINTTVNHRSAVMFFHSISSVKSFEDSLPLIQMIGEGSVGSEFSSMFTMFINNKLDKMITPKAIMDQDEKYVLGTLKSLIDGDKGYRADIAATLSTRMVNYLDRFATENKVEKPAIERIKALVKSDIFTKDIIFNMVKGIYNSNPKKYQLMLLDKEMSTMILK